MLYSFTLPTTSPVSLTDSFNTDYRQMLVNADSARSTVRDTLRIAKRDDHPEYLNVVKALDEYMPFVFTISDHTQQMDTIDFKCAWKMPSAKSLDKKSEFASFEIERATIVLAYALAFINLADQTSRRIDDERFKLVSKHLLQAEAVLTYLTSHPPNVDRVPADLQSRTITGLISLVQGMAHLSTLAKETSYSVTLLMRVAVYASERLRHARTSLDHFQEGLLNWIDHAYDYCQAQAWRYMAVDSAKRDQVGVAIAQVRKGQETLGIGKKLKSFKSKSAEKKAELASPLKLILEELLNEYQHENDRLKFQPVPSLADITKDQWPSGRPISTPAQPWQPPASLIEPERGVSVSDSQYY